MRSILLSLSLLFACFFAFTQPTFTQPTPAAAYDCEGDACTQVTLTFDETKQQYLARNTSSDRWVKVTASNLSAFATACVGPGKSDYLKLRSVVGPYRAEYDEACGASALGE